MPWVDVIASLAARLTPSGGSAWGLAIWSALLASVVYEWSCFLGRRPGPARTRAGLLMALGVTTTVELCLCFVGFFHWWMAFVILVLNAWGPLDAVLRYPIMYDIDTFFTVKQLLLLSVKLAIFSFGLTDLLASLPLLVALSIMDFAALPLLYLVALPLDLSAEEQRRASWGVRDEDLALRVARFAMDPRAHQAARKACQRAWANAPSPASSNGASSRLPLWEVGRNKDC